MNTVDTQKQQRKELVHADRVYRLLDAGKLRLNDDEMITVDDVVFRASKDLARAATVEEMSAAELSALRVVGVNPHDHRWVHAGPCGGTGGSCCPKNEVPRAC